MIDSDEATRIGLKIDATSGSMTLLRTYKNWVSSMLSVEKTSHIIRNFTPKKLSTGDSNGKADTVAKELPAKTTTTKA
jgi:hypothetical protein